MSEQMRPLRAELSPLMRWYLRAPVLIQMLAWPFVNVLPVRCWLTLKVGDVILDGRVKAGSRHV